MKPIFLTAEWRKLAIVNFSVDPIILKPHLPFKTDLDFWNGKCYVSLVGFRFMNTKLKGISIPFHTDFEEINLRFYVRHKEGSTWKRGVTFIKEIVPKPALTFVANSIYKEKYVTLPTRHSWDYNYKKMKITYEWKHKGSWDMLSLGALPTPTEIISNSEEEFITEHYWGYTALGNNRASEYQVEHPRWQTYPIQNYEMNVRFGDLYGSEFDILTKAKPDSIMLAEGSKIIVRASNRLE